MKNIPLTKPYIPKTVFKNLEKMIKKGFLTEGEYTYKFENLIKKSLNVNIVYHLHLLLRH